MVSRRARIRLLPAGLGTGMLNWLGKVRLDKVYLSFKNKYCRNVFKFSQGPLKFKAQSYLTFRRLFRRLTPLT